MAGALATYQFYPKIMVRLTLHPQLAQLEGYSLAFRDTGTGVPIVVIEPGLARTMGDYSQLHYDLAKNHRVISYEHAGIGQSSASPNPRTLKNFVEELRELLAQRRAPPPYVLVGHSLGGNTIRYFAHLYPEEVAGLVFIEHPHEDWFLHVRENWSDSARQRYLAGWTREGSPRTGAVLEETIHYEDYCDTIRGLAVAPDTPVLMFTGTNPRHFEPGHFKRDRDRWAKLQGSLLEGVRQAQHIVDFSTGHWPHLDKPELFARKINEFVTKVGAMRQIGPEAGSSPLDPRN